ncbi:hypothetical protein FB451DRAFT_1391650 [Mycena latifolia]|nr:hypothetical protein FB451DRAFT_1391650 [Mycena latifolia]
MPSPTRLLALAALLISATALVPPSDQGVPNAPTTDLPPPATPDNDVIAQTAGQVDQKSGPAPDAAPNADVPPTVVTALDGTLTNTTIANAASGTRRRDVGRFGKRQANFVEVFAPLPAGQHDGSIEGTAYLTYTVVNNATYNVQACLDWCAGIDGCVFVNLYYEFNNYLLDFVFSEKSNLKCAAYGDIHFAAEKINFGGQASYPEVGNETVPLTYITQSSGWAADFADPDTPEDYDLVFGPTDGANNAPGTSFLALPFETDGVFGHLSFPSLRRLASWTYMGFAFIDKYDVDACAQLCNTRGADRVGGACQYFNIWRAVVNDLPTTYTCSMYYLVTDNSTAVNFGQGDLKVTYSRGYARKNLVIDGGFEGYAACDSFCFTASYANWIGNSPAGGNLDASIFDYVPYAYAGHSVALFGAATGSDALPGTLKPAQRLTTVPGKQYVIQAFFISTFSGEDLEKNAKVDILWNGARVGGVSGFMQWTLVQVAATGTGSDELSFVGGAAPAWTFLDNVSVFEGPVAL